MEGFEGQAEEYRFGPVGDGTSVESHMMKTARKVLVALWDNHKVESFWRVFQQDSGGVMWKQNMIALVEEEQ